MSDKEKVISTTHEPTAPLNPPSRHLARRESQSTRRFAVLNKMRWHPFLKSAGRTALHGLVRGAATAAGGAAFAWALWWIQNH